MNKYQHLVEKEITYSCLGGECQAIVVGIEENKGITIVKSDDPEYELVCLNKKDFPYDMETFDKHFQLCVEMIEKGLYETSKVRELAGQGTICFSTSCAFK